MDELFASVILPSCGFDVTTLLPTKEDLSAALTVGVTDITIADEECDVGESINFVIDEHMIDWYRVTDFIHFIRAVCLCVIHLMVHCDL